MGSKCSPNRLRNFWSSTGERGRVVVTESLSKVYRSRREPDKLAVDGVTLACYPGEVFGLLGANGAGKTTLLRMLSTVLEPSRGKASVAGFDVVHDASRVRANIGFLSATTALYGRLTAREVITYFGSLYGLIGPDLRARVSRAIEQFEISEFADRLCDKLSTGQKQRVSIARTIIHDPPVIFFDEPTAGLDILAGRTISYFIEHARESGKTIVFSTHIMSEVERLCDRVGVIHDGKLAAVGTVPELMAATGETQLERMFLKIVGGSDEARQV